jgi:hypothetical protein
MLTKTSPKEQTDIIIAASDTYAKGKLSANYVCDGATDDIEFESAINKIASNGGGTIKVLAGNYVFNKSVYVTDNLKLIFEPGAVIKLADQTSTNLTVDYAKDDTTVTVQDVSGFSVGEHIGITLDSTTGYVHGYMRKITAINGNVLTVNNAGDESDEGTCLVSAGAKAISHYSMFMSPEGVVNVTVIGGEFDGNKSNIATWLVNKDNAFNCFLGERYSDNIKLKGMYVHDFRFQGIHPVGTLEGSNFYIENCNVTDCDSGGICIDTCSGAVYTTECTCNNNKTAGLMAIDVDNVQISGGTFLDNENGGIEVGHNTLISENIILKGAYISHTEAGTTKGIYIQNSSKVQISDCIIENCETAINVDNHSEDVYVKENIIKACEIAILEENNSDFNIFGPNLIRQCEKEIQTSGTNSFIAALLNESLETNSRDVLFGTSEGWSEQIISATESDLVLKTKFTLKNDYGTGESHICVRETDNNYPDWHNYALMIKSDGFYLTVRHADVTVLDTYAVALVVDQEYDIIFSVSGSSLSVQIDGVERLSATNTDLTTGAVTVHNLRMQSEFKGKGTYGIEII